MSPRFPLVIINFSAFAESNVIDQICPLEIKATILLFGDADALSPLPSFFKFFPLVFTIHIVRSVFVCNNAGLAASPFPLFVLPSVNKILFPSGVNRTDVISIPSSVV